MVYTEIVVIASKGMELWSSQPLFTEEQMGAVRVPLFQMELVAATLGPDRELTMRPIATTQSKSAPIESTGGMPIMITPSKLLKNRYTLRLQARVDGRGAIKTWTAPCMVDELEQHGSLGFCDLSVITGYGSQTGRPQFNGGGKRRRSSRRRSTKRRSTKRRSVRRSTKRGSTKRRSN